MQVFRAVCCVHELAPLGQYILIFGVFAGVFYWQSATGSVSTDGEESASLPS